MWQTTHSGTTMDTHRGGATTAVRLGQSMTVQATVGSVVLGTGLGLGTGTLGAAQTRLPGAGRVSAQAASDAREFASSGQSLSGSGQSLSGSGRPFSGSGRLAAEVANELPMTGASQTVLLFTVAVLLIFLGLLIKGLSRRHSADALGLSFAAPSTA